MFADAESEAQLFSKLPKLYWKWKPGLPDFIEQRLTAAQVIDKASQLLPDTKQAASERAVLLCWLFHVTGDLHQPCHCSSLFSVKQFPKGDRGGNSILLPEPDSNLHSFWDQLLGTKANLAEARSMAAGIWKDAALMKTAEASAPVLDAQIWITEGCELAKVNVYPPELVASVLELTPHTYKKGNFSYEAVGPIELSAAQMQTYRSNATAAARQQVMTAALRLAQLLESIPAN